MRHERPFLLVVVFAMLSASSGAQEVPQPIIDVEFSFSNPGARSMGFGGAFVALADDATAAFANPAGLVQLLEPEISLEGRSWRYSIPFTLGGRVEGEPSGIGLDDTEGLRFGRSEETVTGLSFLSFVYPRKRWSVAFYRHQLANVESFSETQGVFAGDPCCPERFLDQRSSTDLEVGTYGISGACRVSSVLKLGIGLTYFDGTLVSESELFRRDDDSPESFFEPISYLPERMVIGQPFTIDDTDWGFTAGFLWNVSKVWSLGGVYREGPELEIFSTLVTGPESGLGVPAGTVLGTLSLPASFADVWGLGLAYRSPRGRITAAFEWDRVEYSEPLESLGVDDQVIDDADELHLGGEYVFLDKVPVVAVRAGVWLDPDHRARAITDKPFVTALIQGGDDELHYAAGLGFAFPVFQVDLAIDLSDLVDTASISAIYTF
jgi:hypothetical protein